MDEHDLDEFAFETRAIRAGIERSAQGEHAEAIYATSSFVFESAEEAAARFSGERPGNIYSRFTNPTVRMFERRLAALEGGESCVATSSGMSAILSVCMALLRQGDQVVAAQGLFGTTTSLLNQYLTRFGVAVRFVPATDYAAWAEAIEAGRTRLLIVETPTNPLTEVVDIQKLAAMAHAADARLIVDNCFCTPALQRPLALGADIVIHSATKYLDGQGRCMGGAVVGDAETVGRDIFGFLRTAGPTLSPFNAWVFLKGLETLALRMRAHSENALVLARWLQQQPGVARVHYPGLPDHPQHHLAAAQQSDFGGIVSFSLSGGQAAAWRLIDATRLISITANLGDTKTTITHPATTTHGRLSPEDRHAAGIGDGLLRLSVGLESVDDLMQDLGRTLA
ncbi:O-succinylhomoserine sulfhydrylase [Candidatus Macondimonas diazotrophica]|jgi:O-succinylhomoserine sulfhydrylase|uniref:O-succinylhomoserine sulfhydrylase n=1 Tax=Candidatus Macondimonas diazotrophica TaxID=2305248 RepID=A0A4Z0F8T1_9GAMM|nr:O-succinylhomoserine sulfhydrylase [Candidatus Macondimonas diazotrophica]NCU01017.1 O-succinylhomoserine sulfhydrylase [Candidatus Macondimonas diazotrophica]TFZ82197.1 O-succinylhomoserine sulfhydrylase [Candidatus Macondimonas diazotrophica]